MAFATANVVRENGGSLNIVRGSWTGSRGDAVGTVTGKGYCTDAKFLSNLTSGTDNVVASRISNSSGTWTVSVPYYEAVTAGTFEIRFK